MGNDVHWFEDILRAPIEVARPNAGLSSSRRPCAETLMRAAGIDVNVSGHPAGRFLQDQATSGAEVAGAFHTFGGLIRCFASR